jgi:hypothetical protein
VNSSELEIEMAIFLTIETTKRADDDTTRLNVQTTKSDLGPAVRLVEIYGSVRAFGEHASGLHPRFRFPALSWLEMLLSKRSARS